MLQQKWGKIPPKKPPALLIKPQNTAKISWSQNERKSHFRDNFCLFKTIMTTPLPSTVQIWAILFWIWTLKCKLDDLCPSCIQLVAAAAGGKLGQTSSTLYPAALLFPYFLFSNLQNKRALWLNLDNLKIETILNWLFGSLNSAIICYKFPKIMMYNKLLLIIPSQMEV